MRELLVDQAVWEHWQGFRIGVVASPEFSKTTKAVATGRVPCDCTVGYVRVLLRETYGTAVLLLEVPDLKRFLTRQDDDQ